MVEEEVGSSFYFFLFRWNSVFFGCEDEFLLDGGRGSRFSVGERSEEVGFFAGDGFVDVVVYDELAGALGVEEVEALVVLKNRF